MSTRTDVVAPKTIRGEKKRQEERTRLNWPHSTIAFYFILTKQEKGGIRMKGGSQKLFEGCCREMEKEEVGAKI